MELSSFITETLVQIQQGVEEAIKQRKATPGAFGAINPAFGKDANAFSKHHVQQVEFDVAVTVSEKSSKAGKAGLKVFSAELGGEINKDAENSTVSRIKFTIPIIPAGELVKPGL